MLKRKPLLVAILAVVVSIISVERYLVKYQGDHTYLVVMSTPYLQAPSNAHISRMPMGYDGQYYFTLSQSPFRIQPEAHLDSPARHTRILYCVLCWLFSGFGNPFALVWAMYLVNLFLIGATAYLASDWATKKNCPSWWGLLVGLSTNCILSLTRNLTDVCSTLCLVGLLIAWLNQSRTWIIAIWATCTLFAREQNLALVGCLMLFAVGNRKWNLAFAIGLICLFWIGFITWLWIGYGEKPFLRSEGNFGPPFQGYLTHFQRYFFPTKKIGTIERVNLYITIELTAMVVIGLYLTIRSRCWVILLPVLVGIMFIVVSGWVIYDEIWSYGRVFNTLPIGFWFAAVERRWRWYPILCLPNLVLLYTIARNFI